MSSCLRWFREVFVVFSVLAGGGLAKRLTRSEDWRKSSKTPQQNIHSLPFTSLLQ